jgi:hypothetical protein
MLTYGYNVGVLVKEQAAATKGPVAGDPEQVATADAPATQRRCGETESP